MRKRGYMLAQKRYLTDPTEPYVANFIYEKKRPSGKTDFRAGDRREKMISLNYEVASRHYSYSVLRNKLSTIMSDWLDETKQRPSKISSYQ
jgi:hypothetical protein